MPPKITIATSGTVSALKLPSTRKDWYCISKEYKSSSRPPLTLNSRQQLPAVQPQRRWTLLWNLSTAAAKLLGLLLRTAQGTGPASSASPSPTTQRHSPPFPCLPLPLPSSPRAASQKNLPTPPPSLARQSAGHRAPAGFHSPCSWSPKDFDKSGKTIFKRKRRGRKRHLTQNLK